MRRSISSLALALCLLAAPAWAQECVVVVGQPTAAAGPVCDTCAGALILTSHFENADDLTTGTPCGCSTNADKTWALTNAVYSTTQESDGAYSIYIDDDLDTAVIPADLSKTAGTITFDIYVATYGQYTSYVAWYVDSNNFLGCYAPSTGNIFCEYKGNGTSEGVTAAMSNGAWHSVVFEWRTGATDPSISIAIDGGAATTSNTNLVEIIGTPTFQINWAYLTNAAQFYLDDLKVYNAWQ